MLLIITMSINLYAQHEFAPIGAEWYYEKMKSYNPPEYGYIKLTSLKDTIIQNKKSRVIEVVYAPDDTTQIIEGYEYLHQSGDTIWYWKSNQFHMLYNFSMQEGDSILLYSEMLNQCTEDDPYGWNKVDSVFSKTYNGIELKAYTSVPVNNSVWGFENYSCEIFGNTNYLIPQNKGCVYDGIWHGPLRCYSDPENGVLITHHTMKCDSTTTYPVSVSSFNDEEIFTFFPNPVYERLFIDGYKRNTSDKYNIVISDVNGSIVASYESKITELNVSSFTKGVYFITISSYNKIIKHEKIIKY